GATEATGDVVVDHHAPGGDLLGRAGERERERHLGGRLDRRAARPQDRDAAGRDVLGLTELHGARLRLLDREDRSLARHAAPVARDQPSLDHRLLFSVTLRYSAKISTLVRMHRQRVLDDEVGDVIDDRIGQLAGAALERALVRTERERTLALRT